MTQEQVAANIEGIDSHADEPCAGAAYKAESALRTRKRCVRPTTQVSKDEVRSRVT